jgi:signal transduction histidine kinase
MHFSLSALSVRLKRKEFISFWVVIALCVLIFVLSLTVLGALAMVLVAFSLIAVSIVAFIGSRSLAASRSLEWARQRELSALIENLKDGVIMYTPDFVILSMNTAAERLFGVSVAESVGMTVDPSMVRNPHLRTFAQVLFPSLAPSVAQLSETNAWPQIVSITLEDPRLELVATLHRMSDPSGTLIGFLKIIHDQTHEQSVMKTKTEFISVAAHQLRTPLTALKWASENLTKLEEHANPETLELVRQIAQLSERSMRITNDLLDASKIEEGRFGYSFEDTDLVAFVQKVLQEISVLSKEYKIRMFFEPPANPLPSISIDASRIGTVLSNLLDNAIRYNTENGEVIVSIAETSDGKFVRISVRDTGVGVPENESSKLFQKLQRASNVLTIEPNGTGLGLYIAKNIVERHGGTVGFESIEGRGSTFWFTLPLDPSLIPDRESASALA